ncbi:MAG: FlgD immunoglobulin-like domain containing protein [bacterium]
MHEWLVRDMMNGPLGEEVINGTWHQNEVITKTVNYAVPVPRAPAPDIVPDSCRVVVIAYKVGSPLSSNAEIQQAEQWPLLDTGTGIDDPTPRVVNSFALKPNYPNPFNPETCISYDLPPIEGDQRLSLLIYDQLGQKVRTLVNETQSAGSYEVMWNGRDDQGRLTVSGVYFYKLQYGKYQQTRKLILLR